jgi:hypothetical protein
MVKNEETITQVGDETAPAQTPPAESATAEPTGREYLLSRLAERYPDDDFSDDERIFSRLREDIDGYEGSIKEHGDKEKQLADIFSSDPRSAQFLMEWAEGGDPVMLLVKNYGDDFRAVLDDPEKLEQFTQARGEYIERQTKERDLKDQAEKNLAASLEALDAEIAAGGYSEEDADKAFRLLNDIVNDAVVEKVKPETWRICLKAINYDQDVEQAAHEGEVRGRNTKIGELRSKKTTTDNLPPTLSGGGTTTTQEKTVGALDHLASKGDIFDRGNPVRKKRNQ